MPKYTQVRDLLRGIRQHCDSSGHMIKMGPDGAGIMGPYSYWFTCEECAETFEIEAIHVASTLRQNKRFSEVRLAKMLKTPQGRVSFVLAAMVIPLTQGSPT